MINESQGFALWDLTFCPGMFCVPSLVDLVNNTGLVVQGTSCQSILLLIVYMLARGGYSHT